LILPTTLLLHATLFLRNSATGVVVSSFRKCLYILAKIKTRHCSICRA
jgi:hypothetical protein